MNIRFRQKASGELGTRVHALPSKRVMNVTICGLAVFPRDEKTKDPVTCENCLAVQRWIRGRRK